MGAMQAQDYPGAKWSIGLRLPGFTDADIEQAVANKEIVRTWPMRGTLHFVATADIHWLLALMTPRIITGSASRQRNLDLNTDVFVECAKVLKKALKGGKSLTRREMMDTLERAGIVTKGQRGYHILWHLSQEGLLCFGPMQGKEQAFVLLDEWLPKTREVSRDDGLAALTERYFTSHGPATVQDCAWWSGLPIGDVKKGIASAGKLLTSHMVDDKEYWMGAKSTAKGIDTSIAYLLPGFDEYLLGYKDRKAVLDEEHAEKVCPGFNGIFSPTIVCEGRVVGTWRKVIKKGTILITPQFFEKVRKKDIAACKLAAKKYGEYMGMPALFDSL
jgi:hypothetical protein